MDPAVGEAIAILDRARGAADDILRKSRGHVEQLTGDARARAEELEHDAEERHRAALGSLLQSREELERRVDALRLFEREYQRQVGPASMQRIRACLRAAVNDALDQGLIAYNPAVRLRMAPEKKRRPVVWTAERAAAFWEAYRARLAEARTEAAGRHASL